MDFLYLTIPRKSIVIGRDENCDIAIDNPFISRVHLKIQPRADELVAEVFVLGVNGATINGEKYARGSSSIIGKSDYIRINEINVLWMGKCLFLGINNGCNHNSRLQKFSVYDGLNGDSIEKKRSSIKGFLPMLRINTFCDMSPIEVEAPPARKAPQKPSLILAAGPALTMALPILLGAGRKISIVTSIFASMWAVLNVGGHKRKEKQEERRRRVSYTTYIKNKDEEIKGRYLSVKQMLYDDFASINEYFRDGCNVAILWNRFTGDDDGVTIRLGIGTDDFPIDVRVPRERFAQLDDSLRELPMQMKEKYQLLLQVPICIECRKGMIIGFVKEDGQRASDILRAILLQIILSGTREHIGVSLGNDDWINDNLWEIKLSPHHIENSDDRCINAVSLLVGVFTKADEKIGVYRDRGAVVILLIDSMHEAPSFVDKLVVVGKNYNGIIDPNGDKEARRDIDFDVLTQKEAIEYIRILNNLAGEDEDVNCDIPEKVGFYEIFDKTAIKQETVVKLWDACDINESMAFPMGIGSNGQIVYLDLHDKKMGPHGLIAGTTGSGKSELLTTMILSAAMCYPPDKLGFFLIDYKGGSMSNLFKNLPHLRGSISNLSKEESQRAMISLYSENIRRQELFNRVNVSNIKEYTLGYDEGRFSEALPHILIIIDEFAELKKEEPEFMQQIISIAAVGRSLGVHLIMATQKPAGVIDEKIRSNSRFRIALRVEDKSDSVDMLKKADAANISNCGRGYLQVGNDEIYEEFQCAYAFASAFEESREEIEVYDEKKNRIHLNKLAGTGKTKHEEKATWYEVILKAIDNAYKDYPRKDIFISPIWIDSLEEEIPFDELKDNVIGFADAPHRHMHIPVKADLKSWGHTCILGGVGLGKSNLLIAIMLRNLSQSDFYIIDYGGSNLEALAKSKSCGGYIDCDKASRVKMMLAFIEEELERRKKNHGIRQDDENNIVLVIDNLGEVIKEDENAYRIIGKILKYGRKLGILILCSGAFVSSEEIPSRLFDKMDRVITQGKFEQYMLASIFKTKAALLPNSEDIPGRGIAYIENEYLKIQVGKVTEKTITHVIKAENTKNCSKACDYPFVPDDLSLDNFLVRAIREYPIVKKDDRSRPNPRYEGVLPIGYEEETGKIFNLNMRKLNSFIICGRKSSGKKYLCKHIGIVASRYGYSVCSINDPYVLIKQSEKSNLILIDDLNQVLNKFYNNPYTTEDEEIIAKMLSNAAICRRSNKAMVVCVITEKTRSDFCGRPIMDAILEKPYAICMGGSLDENRLLDFSYLPYSTQIKKKKAGYGTVIKAENMGFYGDVIIPAHTYQEE